MLARTAAVLVVIITPASLWAQQARLPMLPQPTRDPLNADDARDPLLEFVASTADPAQLVELVQQAVERAPAGDEAAAALDIARAQRLGAISAMLPNGEANFTGYRVIDRFFGANNATLIERTRPLRRTDLNFRLDQLVFDWMASPNRLRAAAARIESAEDEQVATRERVALETVAAWHDLFTQRSLVALADAQKLSSSTITKQLQERIALGASSEGDLALLESEIAANETRRARFARASAEAAARFEALTGAPPPADLARGPRLGSTPMNLDQAVLQAERTAPLESARKLAQASRYDARAAKGDVLPRLSVGIEGGRFGVFETEGDREVRALFTIRQSLSAGTFARADEAEARSDLARARFERQREESLRDVRIAFSDLQTLGLQEDATRSAYIAARRARDVVLERFRLRSGTLFDVLDAEANLMGSALDYIQAVTERDAAHYVLLSETGTLLEALEFAPSGVKGTSR